MTPPSPAPRSLSDLFADMDKAQRIIHGMAVIAAVHGFDGSGSPDDRCDVAALFAEIKAALQREAHPPQERTDDLGGDDAHGSLAEHHIVVLCSACHDAHAHNGQVHGCFPQSICAKCGRQCMGYGAAIRAFSASPASPEPSATNPHEGATGRTPEWRENAFAGDPSSLPPAGSSAVEAAREHVLARMHGGWGTLERATVDALILAVRQEPRVEAATAADERAWADRLEQLEFDGTWRLVKAGEVAPLKGGHGSWVETNHPAVVACMGSALACAKQGCQYERVRQEQQQEKQYWEQIAHDADVMLLHAQARAESLERERDALRAQIEKETNDQGAALAAGGNDTTVVQTPELSRDESGARAWLVHAIVECANCSPADHERKREYLAQADSALVAYETALGQREAHPPQERTDRQLLDDATAIIQGFVLEDLNGVVCSVPEEGLDAPVSRYWCRRCRDRWQFAYDFLERMKGQVHGDTH